MSLLPPSTTPVEQRLSAATSLSPLEVAADRIAALWDADTCPVQCLPALAWALRVDEWSDTWPEGVRRQVCRDAIYLHRRRGTRASIERALLSLGLVNPELGYTAHIVEGLSDMRHDGTADHDGSKTYGETPSWASWRVELNRPITIPQAASARRVLEATAPARCTLDALEFRDAAWLYNGARTYNGTISHGAA